jgi:hypothetical protein
MREGDLVVGVRHRNGGAGDVQGHGFDVAARDVRASEEFQNVGAGCDVLFDHGRGFGCCECGGPRTSPD